MCLNEKNIPLGFKLERNTIRSRIWIFPPISHISKKNDFVEHMFDSKLFPWNREKI